VLNAPQRDDIAVLVMHIGDSNAPELRVTMPARGRSAPILRERLRGFLRAQHIPDERAFAILNATGEALANAIEHAYDGKDGPVTLVARCENDGVVVEISYNGSWREPAHEEGGVRGRGRKIMESLAHLDIERAPDGTTVRLRF
jgi:anti-sigma regulatory factor (Ser/Thr protein kinase)